MGKTQLLTPKIKNLGIFACPECNRKNFTSIMALNNHLTRGHDVDYKIYLNKQGRACTRRTLKIKVSKATLNTYL